MKLKTEKTKQNKTRETSPKLKEARSKSEI